MIILQHSRTTTIAQKKQAFSKARVANAATVVSTHVCPTHGRTFRDLIGQ